MKRSLKSIHSVNSITDQMNKLHISGINAIIYARCSTKKQNEDNLHSISSQVDVCVNYAMEKEFTVLDIITDIKPGHDINKLSISDIINRNINASDDKKIKVIIVKEPSRISRNPAQGTKFILDCKKEGIIIHSVSDNIDTSTTNELKLFNSLFFDAYSESQQISKRVKMTFDAKKRNGGVLGRPIYGMQFIQSVSESELPIQTLVINEEENEIIKFIVLLYYGGKINKINDQLYTILENMLLTSIQRTGLTKKAKKTLINSRIGEASLYWVDDKTGIRHKYEDDILYGYNTQAFISQILNNFNIKKRENLWTANSVASVIKNYEKTINPICKTHNGDVPLYDEEEFIANIAEANNSNTAIISMETIDNAASDTNNIANDTNMAATNNDNIAATNDANIANANSLVNVAAAAIVNIISTAPNNNTESAIDDLIEIIKELKNGLNR